MRSITPALRMDRIEFSYANEALNNKSDIGSYTCPRCQQRIDFGTRHFAKHQDLDFTNLSIEINEVFNSYRPLNKGSGESFIDFYCPGCELPVRIIYAIDGEWKMGCNNWVIQEILELS